MKKIIVSTLLISGLIGFASSTTIAQTVNYLLTPATYSLSVEGKDYKNTGLPILNYEGNTYVPLKQVGEMVGADVKWNDSAKKVEIQKTLVKKDDVPQYSNYSTYRSFVKMDNDLYDLAYYPNLIADSNNKFYIKLDEQKLNLLIAVATQNSKIDRSDDASLKGTLSLMNNKVYNNFIEKQVKSEFETLYTLRNGEKSYNIVIKENKDKGIIRYNKLFYVPAQEMFEALGIHYTIDLDTANEKITFILNK